MSSVEEDDENDKRRHREIDTNRNETRAERCVREKQNPINQSVSKFSGNGRRENDGTNEKVEWRMDVETSSRCDRIGEEEEEEEETISSATDCDTSSK